MVCVVVLGPTGMHPSDVVSAVDGSLGFRLGLWLAWILAIAPAARALFRDPAIGYLRALPVGVFGSALLGAVGLV